MTESKIDKIYKLLEKSYKNRPTTELYYTNNYTLLVGILLSARTTDKTVNQATKELFKVADNPEKMIKLGLEKLKGYIKTIGLYNNKAKYVLALSKDLIEKFGGKIPRDFDTLTKLPGVGSKTAKVFLNCAFDSPLIGVDTHVFRVSNRLGIAKATTPDKTAQALDETVPLKYKKRIGHWLVLHGRYVCKAQKPLCEECVLNELCDYYRQR